MSEPPGPLRHQPRAGVPRRRVRGAARARGRDVRARRRRRPPRRRRDGADALPFPVLRVRERDVLALAARGRLPRRRRRASGRVALPAAHAGARRARVPFVLWATIWAHPRTAAHALSYLPLRHLYRDADAIATYGPHVSAYVRAKGARNPVFEAPQAVDSAYLVATAGRTGASESSRSLFVGRLDGEKGLAVLLRPGAPQASSTPRRAGSGRRRAVPSPVLRHRRGAADGPAAARRCAQLLRGQRRCGPAVGPHPRLPRAVGARRQ